MMHRYNMDTSNNDIDLFQSDKVGEADLKSKISNLVVYCYNRFYSSLMKSKSASPVGFLKLIELLLKIYENISILETKNFETFEFSDLKSQLIENIKYLEEFENGKFSNE